MADDHDALVTKCRMHLVSYMYLLEMTPGQVLVEKGCNGVTHRRVLGTLCLRHMGCYPTERDIEYLIGL